MTRKTPSRWPKARPSPAPSRNPRRAAQQPARTSTCRFRSARSPRSPASAAAARVRWSKTCSTTAWPASCIARRRFPASTMRSRGVEQINKVIRVDQQPLGNTPTSNPATYTGVFDLIRTALRATARREGARLTRRGGSASTYRADVARRAKATARKRSRCTSCPTCGSSAKRAVGGATTKKRLPCGSTVSRSPTCST